MWYIEWLHTFWLYVEAPILFPGTLHCALYYTVSYICRAQRVLQYTQIQKMIKSWGPSSIFISYTWIYSNRLRDLLADFFDWNRYTVLIFFSYEESMSTKWNWLLKVARMSWLLWNLMRKTDMNNGFLFVIPLSPFVQSYPFQFFICLHFLINIVFILYCTNRVTGKGWLTCSLVLPFVLGPV